MKAVNFLFIVIVLTCTNYVAAQEKVNDPFIVGKKGLFHNQIVIKKSGFTLTQNQIIEFMSNDPQMSSHARALSGIYLGQVLFSAAGSVLSVWPLFQLEFSDKDPNLDITYIGLGAVAASLILKHVFMKHAEKAANYYNNGYKNTLSFRIEPFGRQNEIGIALVF